MNCSRIQQQTHRQRGLSVVELLIALAISSFLILGITQIYIDNKRSYGFQQSQGELQENQRFLAMILDGYLNRAGFQRSPIQMPEEAFKQAAASGECGAFGKGDGVAPTTDGNGLCIRYYPVSTDELDCTGATVPTFDDSKAYSETGDPVLMVLRYIPSNDLNGVLQCKVGTRTAELVTGVADLRLNLRKNDGVVTEVRYAALMASTAKLRSSDESRALDTWMDGANATAKARLESGDQGQLFQMTSNTVTLRNLTP